MIDNYLEKTKKDYDNNMLFLLKQNADQYVYVVWDVLWCFIKYNAFDVASGEQAVSEYGFTNEGWLWNFHPSFWIKQQ